MAKASAVAERVYTDPLDAALDAIPGLRAAEDARARLNEVVPPSPVAPTDPNKLFRDVVTRAARSVRDGLPFPQHIARELIEPQIRHQEPNAFGQVLSAVSFELAESVKSTFVRGVDEGLAVLRKDLDELLPQAQRRSQDPDDLLRLQLQYEQIRRAQLALFRRYARSANREAPADLCETVGFWRSSIDLVDKCVASRNARASGSRADTPAAAAYIQWLGDTTSTSFDTGLTTPWWPDGDPAEHLHWLATSKEAWIPNIGQALEVYAAIETATKRVFGRVTLEQQEARRTYYRITEAWDGYSAMPEEDHPIVPQVIDFAALHAHQQPEVRMRAFEPRTRP